MKRVLAVIMCLMLAVTPALGEMTGAIPVEAAFTTPSTEFSMTTAWFLLSNCMGQGKTDTARQMQSLGLEVVMQEYYNKPMTDHSHTSAFTLATGQLPVRGEMRNVAIITVRGTADGEWYSNFDIAGESGNECMYAENFYAASENIYTMIKPVLDEMEDPVIIATGYSRGAACSNLIGLMLNADFDMEDVYVYTFATPNTVRFDAENDQNIFNIVNVNDMITCMPPEAYGFTRPGTDIELRDPEYINTDMHKMFMLMLGMCPDIDSFYNDRHATDAPGLSEDGITMYEMFLLFADLTSGDEALMQAAQQTLGMLGSTENDFAEFMPLFSAAMSGTGGNGQNQHMPDVYVGLMMQLGY